VTFRTCLDRDGDLLWQCQMRSSADDVHSRCLFQRNQDPSPVPVGYEQRQAQGWMHANETQLWILERRRSWDAGAVPWQYHGHDRPSAGRLRFHRALARTKMLPGASFLVSLLPSTT
jgi:hypothetical protein